VSGEARSLRRNRGPRTRARVAVEISGSHFLFVPISTASAKNPPAVLGAGSIIVAEGFSAPNAYPTELLPPVFHDWCNNGDAIPECGPTVQLEVFDAKNGKSVGFIYAWGQDFGGSADGVSLVFREFILYDLDGGQLYTISEDGGHPGGAFADPTVVIPKVADQVLLGGAEGQVVGGTGLYAGASGGYSPRLTVEVDFARGFFVYYDELYWRFREVRIEN
jgi:hypothetical protein